MSDNPTIEQILEVQDYFGLPTPALVEKDWHVVRALAAIAALDTGDFQLIFGGGTALSRAYKLTKRMSEDVDLRIVRDKPPTSGELKVLRGKITQTLLDAGFVFDPKDKNRRLTMYNGAYTKYQLPYKALAAEQGILRPDVLIETSVFPLRRAAVEKPVASFIAEANEQDAEIPKIACASVLETSAEKLVSLTRRAGAELLGLRDKRDPTLVRHVYDLHMIRSECDPEEVAELAREVMIADADKRGDRFPAYQKDPLTETLRALEGIAQDPGFISGYANFQRDMVYGDKPDFATAMATLNELGQLLKKGQP